LARGFGDPRIRLDDIEPGAAVEDQLMSDGAKIEARVVLRRKVRIEPRMARERMARRLLDHHLGDARRERRNRRWIGVVVSRRNIVMDAEREGHHPFLTHMILINSPSAKS